MRALLLAAVVLSIAASWAAASGDGAHRVVVEADGVDAQGVALSFKLDAPGWAWWEAPHQHCSMGARFAAEGYVLVRRGDVVREEYGWVGACGVDPGLRIPERPPSAIAGTWGVEVGTVDSSEFLGTVAGPAAMMVGEGSSWADGARLVVTVQLTPAH